VKIENFGFEDGAVSQAIGEMREEIFRLERILSDFIKRKIGSLKQIILLRLKILGGKVAIFGLGRLGLSCLKAT